MNEKTFTYTKIVTHEVTCQVEAPSVEEAEHKAEMNEDVTIMNIETLDEYIEFHNMNETR